MIETDTKTLILDAAEQLFAQKGFAATSLRAIIKQAGVNTASAHYHFGSKDGVVSAVLKRHAVPVNEARLEGLEALLGQHTSGALPVAEVVEAFLFPVIQRIKETSHDMSWVPQLFSRAMAEPNEKLRSTIQEILEPVFKRFHEAFTRALPDLTPVEIHWRMHFMVGVMVFTITAPTVHGFGEAATEDPGAMTQRLVNFIVGGMQSSMGGTSK